LFSISLWLLLPLIAAIAVALAVGIFFLGRHLEKREPYGSFLRLTTRRKIRFFRLLLTDKRVPLYARALPIALIPYLASPIDILPDFIPVLGYLDDVALVLGVLALVIRLTPRTVIDDLLRLVIEPDSVTPPDLT
jgi:uncharacterized membrane protein YkvA (DUF1232 family)